MANTYYKLGNPAGSYYDRVTGLSLRGAEVNFIDSNAVTIQLSQLVASGYLVVTDVTAYNNYLTAAAAGTRLAYQETTTNIHKVMNNADWQNSVALVATTVADLIETPGYRAIIGATIAGFEGHEELIAEFNGSKWVFEAPMKSWTALVDNQSGFAAVYEGGNFPDGTWRTYPIEAGAMALTIVTGSFSPIGNSNYKYTGTGNDTVTIPAASANNNKTIRIYNFGTNLLTLSTNVYIDKVNTVSTIPATYPDNKLTLQSDGTNWFKINQ